MMLKMIKLNTEMFAVNQSGTSKYEGIKVLTLSKYKFLNAKNFGQLMLVFIIVKIP